MFKKIKESEGYNKYKELKANPQTRAAMSLGLWLLFFIIIIIFTRGIETSNTKVTKNSVSVRTNNYEYTYQNNDITVFGDFYNNKQIFTILNNKYYYNGENVYKVNSNVLELIKDFDLSILKITPEFIEELTSNLNFTEVGDAKQYLVPLVNFINLYEVDTAVDLSLASNYNVIIQKYYKDNNLYKIEVDLSNYYKINNLKDSGKLIINLYNVNKLNDFTLEYDRMLGVK